MDTIFLKHFGVCYWLAHQTVLSAIDGKGLSIFLCSMSFCMILFVTPAIIPSYPCSSQAPRFLLVFIHFFYGLPQEMMFIMTAGQVKILLLIR